MLAFLVRTFLLLAATFGIGAIAGRITRSRARKHDATATRPRHAETRTVRQARSLHAGGEMEAGDTQSPSGPSENANGEKAAASTRPGGDETASISASVGQPSFAGYGGSGFVTGAAVSELEGNGASDSIVHEGEGATPLAAPDLHGRTPTQDERSALAEDPLARRHQTDTLDFKTVDYGNMKAAARTAAEAASRDDGWTVPEGYLLGGSDIHVESPAAFKSFGGSGAMHGAPERALDPLNTGEQETETAISPPSRLDAARGGVPDDLTRISGIGPSIERLLFDNGIFHFDQIAVWTADNMRWADELSGFQGRVEREEWVDQAKTLASERTAG